MILQNLVNHDLKRSVLIIMKKTLQLITGKVLAIMSSLIMILIIMPCSLSANAYSSAPISVPPEGGTFSYTATAVGGCNKIVCSPESMFDKSKCSIGGKTLYYKVKSNYGSSDKSGTITLYNNNTKRLVLNVKQSRIILNVTPSTPKDSTISGNGERLSFTITSNMKVTANLTGEVGGSSVIGTVGSSTSQTWTRTVSYDLPAFDYSPTTSSRGNVSSHQNRDRAIGIVFTAGPKYVSIMYSQAPRGFMFGKATNRAPWGTVCYNGYRYPISMTDTPITGGQHVYLSEQKYNWWELAMCEIEGGDEYSARVNGFSTLCSLISAASNIKRDTTIVLTIYNDRAYITGYDTETTNALIDSRAVVPQGDFLYYFSSDRWNIDNGYNFYKFYLNKDGKLCQALNYLKGDMVTYKGRTVPPFSFHGIDYPSDGNTYWCSSSTSMFAPFYATSSYMDVLRNKGNLLGWY